MVHDNFAAAPLIPYRELLLTAGALTLLVPVQATAQEAPMVSLRMS